MFWSAVSRSSGSDWALEPGDAKTYTNGTDASVFSVSSVVKLLVSRVSDLRLQSRRHFIPPEILPLGRLHLRHRHIRFAVVVIRIPEQESISALVLRRQNLHFNVLRRIRLRPPRKRLQPRTNHHPAPRCDLLKPLHRLPNKMLRRIPRLGNPVHPKKV